MNIQTIKTSLSLLKIDLYKYYKKTFRDDLINKVTWIVCVLAIATYIWPSVGMSESFGVFMALGSLVSCCFWDSWGLSAQFVADMEGERVINYYSTLPLPAWLFFAKQIVFYAVRSMVPALIMVPLSKLILWDKLDLTSLYLGKFLIIFVLTSIFCATLSLCMTSLVRDMSSIDNISIRFLFPMWFFGGSQFSWYTFYGVSPLFAYINLLNPLVYAMEGMRVAFLGQSGYLPFWVCVGMLVLYSFMLGFIGIKRLIRRLDCVRACAL